MKSFFFFCFLDALIWSLIGILETFYCKFALFSLFLALFLFKRGSCEIVWALTFYWTVFRLIDDASLLFWLFLKCCLMVTLVLNVLVVKDFKIIHLFKKLISSSVIFLSFDCSTDKWISASSKSNACSKWIVLISWLWVLLSIKSKSSKVRIRLMYEKELPCTSVILVTAQHYLWTSSLVRWQQVIDIYKQRI